MRRSPKPATTRAPVPPRIGREQKARRIGVQAAVRLGPSPAFELILLDLRDESVLASGVRSALDTGTPTVTVALPRRRGRSYQLTADEARRFLDDLEAAMAGTRNATVQLPGTPRRPSLPAWASVGLG